MQKVVNTITAAYGVVTAAVDVTKAGAFLTARQAPDINTGNARALPTFLVSDLS